MKNVENEIVKKSVLVCESLGKISGSYGVTEFFVFSDGIGFGDSW
jgi:hypothetical protein